MGTTQYQVLARKIGTTVFPDRNSLNASRLAAWLTAGIAITPSLKASSRFLSVVAYPWPAKPTEDIGEFTYRLLRIRAHHWCR